jgi:hypothetical protein
MNDTTYKTRGEALLSAQALAMANDRIAQLERQIKQRDETIEQLQAKAATLDRLETAMRKDILTVMGAGKKLAYVHGGYSVYDYGDGIIYDHPTFTAALDALLGDEVRT